MSLEPWPPLHRRPEVRKRLARAIVLTILLGIALANIIRTGSIW